MTPFGSKGKPVNHTSADGGSAGRDLNVLSGKNFKFNYNLAPIPPTPRQLQLPCSTFTDRASLLAKALDSIRASRKTRGYTSFAFFGMGGIGKTAAAIVVADTLKTDFPTVQLQIDLLGASNSRRPPLSTAEAMGTIIRSLEPTVEFLADTQEGLEPIPETVLTPDR